MLKRETLMRKCTPTGPFSIINIAVTSEYYVVGMDVLKSNFHSIPNLIVANMLFSSSACLQQSSFAIAIRLTVVQFTQDRRAPIVSRVPFK